jgi:hypothetical protein
MDKVVLANSLGKVVFRFFFFLRNFATFLLEKYDFNLYKGLSMKNNGPNLPDFEKKGFANCQIFMISSSR